MRKLISLYESSGDDFDDMELGAAGASTAPQLRPKSTAAGASIFGDRKPNLIKSKDLIKRKYQDTKYEVPSDNTIWAYGARYPKSAQFGKEKESIFGTVTGWNNACIYAGRYGFTELADDPEPLENKIEWPSKDGKKHYFLIRIKDAAELTAIKEPVKQRAPQQKPQKKKPQTQQKPATGPSAAGATVRKKTESYSITELIRDPVDFAQKINDASLDDDEKMIKVPLESFFKI